MRRSGRRKNPRKRIPAAPEAALRGAAAGCRPVRVRRTQSGLHDGWRILWRPRKTAALKLRRRQGRASRPRCRIKGSRSRRSGPRPAASGQADRGQRGRRGDVPRPLCAHHRRGGLYVGRKARFAAGIPCSTSRRHGYQYHPDLEPGKFPRGGPAQGPPSTIVRGGWGWICGGWSFAPVRSRRAANTRKEYIEMGFS